VGSAPVIDGWNEALVGQKVGSQIVVVIPADKGYGDAGSPPSIPGGATLVFVIDILSAAG
jgi:peptidylprolyl isomerase